MSWLFRRGRSTTSPPPSERRSSARHPGERATVADLRLAYRLVLKRDPDPDGLASYKRRIADGLSLDELIASLLASEERHERLSTPAAQSQVPLSNEHLIDPQDVIRQLSIAELNETSDEYYRRMWDPAANLRKPFASVHEAPEMLENLGALMGGLHLGKAMTVLDFGAGTCWLSRLLAQLNCALICCDPSPAALEIGKRFFAEHPPLGHEVLPARFLLFDGGHLELSDASIDRIICFDSFHHVPNQAQVLREFGRVLRTGGIAGFSEPGRYHSRSPQSQFEMKNYRVLENDINLREIFAHAESAGFTNVTIRLLNDLQVSLEDYLAVLDGDEHEFVVRESAWQRTRDTLHNRTIFFLHKGDLQRDSRGHVGLKHHMRVEPETWPASAEWATLTFTIRNTGDAHWLNQAPEIFGLVRLACHLYEDGNVLVDFDYFRTDLHQSVAPGETIQMSVTMPRPVRHPCALVFDLVAEGVQWFESYGSLPVTVTVK